LSEYVLRDCQLLYGGYDLSGDMNQMELSFGAEIKDITPFRVSSKRKIAGLLEFNASHEGFYQAGSGEIDAILYPDIGSTDKIMTVCPETGAAGEIGYTGQCLAAEYSPSGQVGEVFAFSVTINGDGELIRSTIMENGAKTVTGNGIARQLGAVAAGKKLYAVMHVVAASGDAPTLDMVIESDDAQGMASPVTRITFVQAAAIGAQWLTADGPITDTWFRARWTVGGVNPSFTVVVIVGIK